MSRTVRVDLVQTTRQTYFVRVPDGLGTKEAIEEQLVESGIFDEDPQGGEAVLEERLAIHMAPIVPDGVQPYEIES